MTTPLPRADILHMTDTEFDDDIDFGPDAPGVYVPPLNGNGNHDPGPEPRPLPDESATDAAPPAIPPALKRAVDGATFIFREPSTVPAVWGKDEAVAWSCGEPLMIVGSDGVGKTAIAQQLVLGRIGLRAEVLGMPVVPADKPVLYIAADRPRQAARSFARMVIEADRAILERRLIVWEGPLPFDLTEDPRRLAEFAKALGVGTVFVDSLKDVALDLSKDEVGSRVNLAHQELIAEGIELCSNHHQRKQTAGAGKPKHLADVYGSRWLTAGCGSVLLLWGESGDAVVELIHLKQPGEEVGPHRIIHDHARGASSLQEPVDLEQILTEAAHGLTVADAARHLFETDAKPTPNQTEKARRRLESLIARGHAGRRDDPDGLARYFLRTQ
jgi:AAA domain